MKIGRYKAITPVTDFSVSQRIRVQLIEDGHTDLAVESIVNPIRDLELKVGTLQDRVHAYELEKVQFLKDNTATHRIIDARIASRSSKFWLSLGAGVAKWAGNSLVKIIIALLIFVAGWFLKGHT